VVKEHETIKHEVSRHVVNVSVVDQDGKKLDGFTSELWFEYGTKSKQCMPGGACTWEVGTTNTLFFVFIDGGHKRGDRSYHVRVSHAFPGISKDIDLVFVLNDYATKSGQYTLCEPDSEMDG